MGTSRRIDLLLLWLTELITAVAATDLLLYLRPDWRPLHHSLQPVVLQATAASSRVAGDADAGLMTRDLRQRRRADSALRRAPIASRPPMFSPSTSMHSIGLCMQSSERMSSLSHDHNVKCYTVEKKN